MSPSDTSSGSADRPGTPGPQDPPTDVDPTSAGETDGVDLNTGFGTSSVLARTSGGRRRSARARTTEAAPPRVEADEAGEVVHRTSATQTARRRTALLVGVGLLALAGMAAAVALNTTRNAGRARVAASQFPVRGQTLITPAEPGVGGQAVEEARPLDETAAPRADEGRLTVATRHPVRPNRSAARAAAAETETGASSTTVAAPSAPSDSTPPPAPVLDPTQPPPPVTTAPPDEPPDTPPSPPEDETPPPPPT
jgi:hypothetical protein